MLLVREFRIRFCVFHSVHEEEFVPMMQPIVVFNEDDDLLEVPEGGRAQRQVNKIAHMRIVDEGSDQTNTRVRRQTMVIFLSLVVVMTIFPAVCQFESSQNPMKPLKLSRQWNKRNNTSDSKSKKCILNISLNIK